MKNLVFAAIVISALLTGCSGGGTGDGSTGAEAKKEIAAPKEKPGVKVMDLYPNIKDERRLQQSVDNGYQLWRLEPIEVAHAALIIKGIDALKEDCAIVEEHAKHVAVEASGDGYGFVVHLKKLVGDDGIWTATEIEYSEDPDADHYVGTKDDSDEHAPH